MKFSKKSAVGSEALKTRKIIYELAMIFPLPASGERGVSRMAERCPIRA